MSTDRLELLLHEVAHEIDYPDTPDLSLAVATRLTRDPVTPQPVQSRAAGSRWLRPALAVGLVIVLIGFFTLAFSPSARRAVADLLGVVGIRITIDGDGDFDVPGDPARPDLSEVDLGRRVSLAEAQEAVDFDVKVPTESVQGGWLRSIFLDPTIGDSGMVSLAYQSDALDDKDVEFLVTQFQASVDETFMKKSVGSGGQVRFVDVRGTTGFWVTGDPHLFYYLGSDGDLREESLRLAGNVLLWEEAGITYRVEGARSLAEAQRIAESLR